MALHSAIVLNTFSLTVFAETLDNSYEMELITKHTIQQVMGLL